MSNEITKGVLCVLMRSGVQVWIPTEKLESFDFAYEEARSNGAMMKFEGERINPADVSGVFKAKTMDELTRRKNGQWQCQHGSWHDRGEKCDCISKEEKEYKQKREEAIKNCGKCENGWIKGENGMRVCDCVKKITKPQK